MRILEMASTDPGKPARGAARAGLAVLAAAALALSGCASKAVPAAYASPPACPATAAPVPGSELIHRFYEAFNRRDFPAMACCYHPQIEFTDSIFGTLKGKRALAMWAMLLSPDGDLRVQVSNVKSDDTRGSAHWDAQYTFPFLAFNNAVNNSVDAVFELKDGLIYRHRDTFDLPRWMASALWPLGGVISESTIRQSVQDRLDGFIQEHPAFQENSAP